MLACFYWAEDRPFLPKNHSANALYQYPSLLPDGLQKALPVLLVDFAHDTAGIAYCYHVGRYVMRHDTAGTDDGIIAYRNARHDDDARTEPAALADMNRKLTQTSQVHKCL